MHAASREALEQSRSALQTVLTADPAGGATGAKIGAELFEVVSVLEENRALRVAVADTAGVLAVADARVAELVGGLWAADLPAGTLVSSGLIVERLEVGTGQALVGLALPPGGWPSTSLRAGDTVMVLGTGNTSGSWWIRRRWTA